MTTNSITTSLDLRATVTESGPAQQGSVPERFEDAPGRNPRPPKHGGRRLLLLAALVVVVAFIVGLLPRLRDQALVSAQTKELAVATVSVSSPVLAPPGPPLTLSGELKPLVEASIYARSSGYVRRWLVDLGARVEAGQLLAELDTPEVDRELSQARAQLVQAEAARNLAATTAKRWREMLAGKTVSSQEADEKSGDLELKKATVEAAQANVQRLENIAGFAKITAPFPGIITARRIDVGQLVTGGAGDELFRLAQVRQLRLFVRVPQTHARSVAVGQKTELTLAEIPGRVFEATVVRTAGAVDAASRTLLVELSVDNKNDEILAGSYAQVRLPEAKAEAALTLPSNTLIFRPDGIKVAVISGDRATFRPVSVGRDFGSLVEVLSGVTAQEKVVVNPPDSLVDGATVHSVEAPAMKP